MKIVQRRHPWYHLLIQVDCTNSNNHTPDPFLGYCFFVLDLACLNELNDDASSAGVPWSLPVIGRQEVPVARFPGLYPREVFRCKFIGDGKASGLVE